MLHASRALEEGRIGGAPLETSSNSMLIVLGLALVSAGLLVLPWWFGAVAAFRYVFLILIFLVGLVLYRSFPVFYVGYVWWLGFLTPLVRRIVDFQIGWQDTNLVMQSFHLVLGLSVFTLIRHRHRLLDKTYFPFVLVLAGLSYGYVIGALKNGPFNATRGFMEWAFPVLFGLHVALLWREYPALRQCIQRTFLWGVAVMGLYGLVQYFLLPPWDAYWMNEFAALTYWGRPRPMELRVFSTMENYLLFGKVMVAGLVVLFSLRTWKHVLVAVPGYMAFLLTTSRTAWGAWLVAVVLMAVWIKGRVRSRLVLVLIVGALLAPAVLSVPQVSSRIGNRFLSFQNLEEDGSFLSRQRLYQENALVAVTEPVGRGFGAQYVLYDSGLLMTPYLLGWPGVLLFMSGLLLLARFLWKSRRRTDDAFALVSIAIVFAFLVMLLMATPFIRTTGAVLWCFIGLVLASHSYHRAQERDEEPAESEPEGTHELS